MNPDIIRQGKKSFNETSERHMKESGLHCDAMNSWNHINYALQMANMSLVHEVPTYEEYFEEKSRGEGMKAVAPDYYEDVMNASDSEAILKYNELVAAFNENLPSIKKDKNYHALIQFYYEMYQTLYGEKCPLKLKSPTEK